MSLHYLNWPFGLAVIDTAGGRLASAGFRLPEGRSVYPLHAAPWIGESGLERHLPLLRQLRGEWPCVPFGFDAERPPFPGWPASSAATALDVGHGFAASNEWEVLSETADRIALGIDYPEDHPIRRLERSIACAADGAALSLELTIHARHACSLPIGLHPTLRLPAEPGAGLIDIGADIEVMTYPGDPADLAILAPGRLAQLGALPLRAGGHLDGRAVPFAMPTEELVQILRADGAISFLNRAEGYRVRLGWNEAHFPSLLIWISNGGHVAPPWNGRHYALGLEPICAAFDLGVGVSTGPNPLNALAVPTARSFASGEIFRTEYRLAVEPE